MLIKNYQALQLKIQQSYLYKIIDKEICKKTKEEVFRVQVAGKNVFLTMSPGEIAADDAMLRGFSLLDVRTITYFNQEYHEVLGHTLRFVFAGTLSVLFSSFLNVYAISRWKVLLQGRLFWLRSLGSTAIGETVLSSIGLIIGFAGIEPMSKIIELGLTTYFSMLAYSAITATPVAYLVYYLKKSEGVDTYDYNVNYNPFKFSIEEQ